MSIWQFIPEKNSLNLSEIFLRLVRSSEERCFQKLMEEHHYLGALPKISETSKNFRDKVIETQVFPLRGQNKPKEKGVSIQWCFLIRSEVKKHGQSGPVGSESFCCFCGE